MIPSSMLMRYFKIAQGRLRRLAEDDSSDVDAESSWYRSQIVEAQLASLDEVIRSAFSPIDRGEMQSVLLQIGRGDFSSVIFDENAGRQCALPPAPAAAGLRRRPSAGGDGGRQPRSEPAEDGQEQQSLLVEAVDTAKTADEQEQQSWLAEAVENTNELAQRAYARSVLASEWRRERERQRGTPQSHAELRGNGNDNDGRLDAESTLEYCGLMLAAARLPEVHRYLREGALDFSRGEPPAGNEPERGAREDSAELRLSRVQTLYWRALGWEPVLAAHQLERLLSGKGGELEELEGTLEQIKDNPEGMETLLKYASVMTVTVTNASMAQAGESRGDPRNDDGTTRVVGVSYSEKIVTVPTDGQGTTSRSLAPPTANAMDEHEITRQRQDFDAAQQAAKLQQQIWSEFEALLPAAQAETMARAKEVQRNFLERLATLAPGEERVRLMQNMDSEVQKLLVLCKLWHSHNSSGA